MSDWWGGDRIWPAGNDEWHQRAQKDREILIEIIEEILSDYDAVSMDEVVSRFARRLLIPIQRAEKEFRVHKHVLPVVYPAFEIRRLKKSEIPSLSLPLVGVTGQYVLYRNARCFRAWA